ncbi:putative bifunctional diguanylate cyclase/phosphodiesterase [Kutzneria albida]|uniref:Diguanylate cyclase/phosphodiesterase with PAS/PAC sensor(S) n=1 Tax=Kutzneria albida DSM 43870 TaxID=1449976 RepID=W5WHA4_9PSEU|nr:EAL domain-containing protein [Kutzneria albida]AHI00579.1 hypothetical protein KALB_7221 [Kutzneria albida DSM 43870]
MADEQEPSARDHEQGGALDPGLAEFARLWTGAVITTSNVPLSRKELRGILTGFAEVLAESLRRADPEAVTEIGRGLVAAQLVGPHALDATLRVVGRSLPAAAGLPQCPETTNQVIDLLGALSAGYMDALREHIFGQQETMKKAVFRARDAAERALRASERRFRTLFSESVVGIAIGDIQGHIVSSNLALQEMLGYSADELRQRTAYDLMPAQDAEDMAKAYRKLINGTYTSLRSEQRMIRGDGEPIWVHIAVTLIRDENGLADYPVVMIEDITDLHLLQERWRHQTLHDPLTGLLNRALFLSKTETAIGGLAPGERVGLAVFGVDGFGVVNGALSDEVGNRVLKTIADRLRGTVDEDTGLLARINGDRFGMLVLRSSARGVVEVAERALKRISEPIAAEGRQLSLTASVGIVERPADRAEPTELLRDAEMALGWAKLEGKAQWALYEEDRGGPERRALELATQLPQALVDGQLSLEYEPLGKLSDRTLAGVEARLTWEHPELGVLGPEEFLAAAERTGQVGVLGRWVVREAAEQAAAWAEEFGEQAPVVCIGLPNRQSCDQDLIRQLMSVVDQTGVRPELLQLEVDQSVVRDRDGEPLEALSVMVDNGFRVVVSGVGAGGSGPLALAGLPVHGIKLASGFVATLGDGDKPDPTAERAIGTAVSLAHLAELTVHAAGVDREQHAATLRELGVDVGQGQHFGPPALPFEVEPMITSGTVDPEW